MSQPPNLSPKPSTAEPCPTCGAAPCACPELDAEEAAEQDKERAHRAAIERALVLLPNSPGEARRVLQEALERPQSDTADD
jgi:hypothetical protein